MYKKLWKLSWNLKNLFSSDVEIIHGSILVVSIALVYVKNFPHLQQHGHTLKVLSNQSDSMSLDFLSGCPRAIISIIQ